MDNINPDTGLEIVPPAPTLVAPPTASTIYSAPNITQAVTAPVTPPNLSDPYGLYTSFMSTPEILAAQQAVAQGQSAINASQQALRTTTGALEGQNINALGGTGASVNLIGRQVGRARDLTANELAGLGETQNAAIANLATLKETAGQKYQIAQNERAQIQDLIRQTSGKAGISFTDSYETALQKTATYDEKVKKEAEDKAKEDKKDNYKQDLKSELRKLGLKTSGSTKDMEKRLSKYNKTTLADVKSKSDAKFNMDIALSKKELGKPYYAPKDGDVKELDWSNAGIQKIIDEEVNTGQDWEQIATKLEAAQPGITKSGGVADKYLQYRFGTSKNNPFAIK